MDSQSSKLIYFIPVTALYLTLILGGLVLTAIESTGYIPALGLTHLSLQSYNHVLSQPGFLGDLLFTLYFSLTSATLSLIIGTYLSFRLSKSKSKFTQSLVKAIMNTGLITPYLYMIFAVTLLFGRTGILSRLLMNTGLINGFEYFPSILFNKMGLGIMLVYVFKGVPFVTLFLLNLMVNINNTYDDVAKTLGAKDITILRKIYIPLCSSTLTWTGMVLFAFDLGSYEVPNLLGNTNPKSLSLRLFSSYSSPRIEDIPRTMALAIIMFVIGITTVGIYGYTIKRLTSRTKPMSKSLVLKTSPTRKRRQPTLYFAGLVILFIVSLTLVIYIPSLSLNTYFKYPKLLPIRSTFNYWTNLLTRNTLFYRGLSSSALVGTTTAFMATTIGLITGRGIVVHFRDNIHRALMLVSIPIFIPGISLFMGSHQLLIHSPFANQWFGVALAHTLICIPYTTNIAISYFQGIDMDLEHQARTLGADNKQRIIRILLPLLLPGIGLSMTVSFLISNTEYFSTFLIGGGNTITLSLIMYPYISNSDWGHGSAIGIVFLLGHLLLFTLVNGILKRKINYQALYTTD